MLTPSPCRARKPALLQIAWVRISSRPTRGKRSLEIKRVHSVDVQIVVFACALKQIQNRAALLWSVSNRCWPGRPGCQFEGISGYWCNLLYSLCIDETSNEHIEDHNSNEERGTHSANSFFSRINDQKLLPLAIMDKSQRTR